MHEEEIAALMANTPRIAGLSWPMSLALAILDTLDERDPGFKNAVQDRLESCAKYMERKGDSSAIADVPSVRDLAASWIFTV